MIPVVLLDADGPLFNFTRGWFDALASIVPGRYTVSMHTQWSLSSCDFFHKAAAQASMSPRELKRRVDDLVMAEGFCAKLQVQPGAQAAVEELKALADVYVVTSPWDSSKTWMHERMHAVHKHFDIPRANVIQTASKQLVNGHVFVDDKPTNVRRWGGRWITGAAFLFDMHHNRGADHDLRRGAWGDIIAEAERLAHRASRAFECHGHAVISGNRCPECGAPAPL